MIHMYLNVEFFGGYLLLIEIEGDEFTSRLMSSSCTWREELTVKKQYLKLENFKITQGEKIRGEIYIEAQNNLNKYRKEIGKVKIKGYFEMDLVDLNNSEKPN